ncbi:MAG TPA: FkbM family methyltransferase [Candidatus Krumholzibacteria bacterium]|nr:FkbM family methyltransferase [Candidatus Krumholzibacteria bacterium]
MLEALARRIQRHRDRRTFREYGHEVKRFHLEHDGVVEYAQWLHPFEKPKTITQDMVDGWRTFLGDGDLAIDVGAHTGDTTVPMALACGPSGLVVAVEPNRYVFRVLEANAALNRDRAHILPLNVAATESDGEFEFHYWDASFGNGGYLSRLHNQRHGHHYPLRVTGRNLEHELRERMPAMLETLALIKTDAEGYDAAVLRSVRGLIDETLPVLISEMHKKLDHGERLELFEQVARPGYRAFRYTGGPQPVGEPVTRDDLQRWPHFDVVSIPEHRTPR